MGNDIPFRVEMEVLNRSGWRCELCGGNNAPHLHHIIYRRYRNHNKENIIVVCEDHNPHKKPGVDKQLKTMLCTYYESQGNDRDGVRKKTGGKYYDEELSSEYKSHLRMLQRRYDSEESD